ncbi:MAG: nucleotidyltransferase domain-containing protein, partial [Thermodesulfobacteriota bacterium]
EHAAHIRSVRGSNPCTATNHLLLLSDKYIMDREKVLRLLKETLERDEQVIFAYVYGSFVKEQSFRDIDIGVYIKNSEENPLVVSADMKTRLSRAVRREDMDFTADQFDVQIINHAPFTFLKRVFKEGKLLVDRDPELRTDLVEYVSSKYRECAGLLAEASLL